MLTFRSSNNITNRSFANPNDIRGVFRENRAELEWLAYFITGDRTLALKCVSEACSISLAQNSVFTEWLLTWARHATVRCSINSQRHLIKQLSSDYCQPRFIRQVHEPLRGEALEFVIENAELFTTNLDVVCRVTLAVCGVQGKSIADAAILLSIPLGGVQAAYSAAMTVIEATRYQHVMHDHIGVVHDRV